MLRAFYTALQIAGGIDAYFYYILNRIGRNWQTIFIYFKPSNLKYAIIIGLGHPAMGTGFTSSLFKRNGLDVGHEVFGKDGIVSWMACVDDTPPNAEADRVTSRMLKGSKLFAVVRSPINSIHSVIRENDIPASLSWRRRHIKNVTGKDIIPELDYSHIDSLERQAKIIKLQVAIDSMYYWYSIILSHRPDIIYRVDRTEDDNLLGDFVGSKIVRNESIWKNSKALVDDTRTLDSYDIKLIGPEYVSKLLEMLDKFHYDRDFYRISELANS